VIDGDVEKIDAKYVSVELIYATDKDKMVAFICFLQLKEIIFQMFH
jgi:hypothetical protein